jgi:RHS repeat-associated protein
VEYLFTGKQVDAETGWYNFGARYLDPKTGIWLSSDPALGEYIPRAPLTKEDKEANGKLPGNGGIYNPVNFALYHFAGNNPIRYTDPDGRRDLVNGTPGKADEMSVNRQSNGNYFLVTGGSDYPNYVSLAVANLKLGNENSSNQLPSGDGALTGVGIQLELGNSPENLQVFSLAAASVGGIGSNQKKPTSVPSGQTSTRMTSSEATKAAKALGFERTNYRSHGQPVFTDGKKFISPDVGSGDGSGSHNGGVWKMAKTPEALNSKDTRTGTFDAELNRVGD